MIKIKKQKKKAHSGVNVISEDKNQDEIRAEITTKLENNRESLDNNLNRTDLSITKDITKYKIKRARTKDEVRIKQIGDKLQQLKSEIQKIVIGQDEVIEDVIIALICNGHILLEGVPGLAKSLLVETLSRTIKGTSFRRIQFVPDLLPSDILGVNAYNPKKGDFYIIKGPIFANFILADEINRAPPKTQAAMMEVMQEKKVNISKHEFPLPKPFLVLATQNPLEQYGVYPLPEAIVDRFFMKVIVDYPKKDEEFIILENNTLKNIDIFKKVSQVIDAKFIMKTQEVVRNIYVSDAIKRYIVEIVNTSRGRGEKFRGLKYVKYGGSPRASIWLTLGARAVALLNGRNFVVPDDVKRVIHNILRHRILLNYEGKALGISTDEIIDNILEVVEVP